MFIVGIDPGATGALALVDAVDDTLLDVYDMPILKLKIGATVSSQVAVGALETIFQKFMARGALHVYIEQVGSTPGKGAVQMFRFGENFGILKGVVHMLACPVTYVSPAEWKRAIRCPREKDGARIRASQLFPLWSAAFTRGKDDGRAEASMLALYGARHMRLIGGV